MTDDLVKRLRNPTYYTHPTTEDGRLAADRIEQLVATNKQLTAERDRLRDALRGLERASTDVASRGASTGPQWFKLTVANSSARAALKGESHE